MSEPFIVGLDGGGTKTLIAVADRSGRVIELAEGGGTSPIDSATWRQVLADQVRPFAVRAGLAGVAAALPAYGEVAAISASQEQAIRDLFGSIPQRVLNDVDAAHTGAFAGGPGILILAGTGSMAWARDAAGVSHRTGGWGAIVGDEGSGYWVGKRVLSAVSKAIDGRAGPTELVAAAFGLLGLRPGDEVNQLEGWAAQLREPRTAIASLAEVALNLAGQGDVTARAILDDAAKELAQHVRTLEMRLAEPAIDWSFAGGLFASTPLRQAVVGRVGRPPTEPRLPPIGGALLAAARHIGWRTDDGFVAKLASSIKTVPARSPAVAEMLARAAQ